MKKTILVAAALLISLGAIVSCTKFDDNIIQRSLQLPEQDYDYQTTNYPSGFLENLGGDFCDFCPTPNGSGFINDLPINNATATLGRVLFYDPQMSLNNSVACASCHHQTTGFADPVAHSVGFGGRITPRNSSSIANVRFSSNLFWDSRVSLVTDLVSQPLQNHIEMGMESLDNLTNKLSKVEYYPELFQNAYGSPDVTQDRIRDAVAQFLTSMVSCDTKYDHELPNNFAGFTPLENIGRELFFSNKAKCSQCHAGSNFKAPDNDPNSPYSLPTIKGTANIGLDIVYADNGKEDGQFKIPTLRNIALTAPYMHDGRFKTLEEVVEHYNSGVKAHTKLDDKLKTNGTPQHLNLNDVEKMALVAFLNTLTDQSMITDPKFANPFKQ